MLKITRDALETIANDKLFTNNDIRFVGGTALSLLINHRLSEDLDFAALELNPQEIISMMKSYGAVKMPHDPTMVDYISNEGDDIDESYMKFLLNDVKVEFFVPPFNILEIENIWGKDNLSLYEKTNVKISSLNTIFYMKTMAFWNRKKYRDLFDIYFVLNNGFIRTDKFISNYLDSNIQYTIENLYKKIQSINEFSIKKNDEGLSTLVDKPKSYEWYRSQIENLIYEEYLKTLY